MNSSPSWLKPRLGGLVCTALVAWGGYTVGALQAGARSAPAPAPADGGFYTQHQEVGGLQIVASARVSPFALAEARWIVEKMVPPGDLTAFRDAGLRLIVLATTEMLTDLPEYADRVPQIWWNRRYRGIGPGRVPAIVCSEENLLDLDGDPHGYESTCLHEVAHAVADVAQPRRDARFSSRSAAAFSHARSLGRWEDAYASQDVHEYLAVGAQAWFGDHPGSNPARIESAEALRAYDPELYALCAELFTNAAWQYVKPWVRPGADREHLLGFDRVHADSFTWPDRAQFSSQAVSLPWLSEVPRSSPSGHAKTTWLIFRNSRPAAIEVYWLDQSGEQRPWFKLRPGEEHLQDALEGHIWYVREGTLVLGAVEVPAGVGFVQIQ